MDQPARVYWLYDAADLLIYIGFSSYLPQRFKQHAQRTLWWHEVVRYETRWFPARAYARQAETNAILASQPKYNIVHTPRFNDLVRDPRAKRRRRGPVAYTANGIPYYPDDPSRQWIPRELTGWA